MAFNSSVRMANNVYNYSSHTELFWKLFSKTIQSYEIHSTVCVKYQTLFDDAYWVILVMHTDRKRLEKKTKKTILHG